MKKINFTGILRRDSRGWEDEQTEVEADAKQQEKQAENPHKIYSNNIYYDNCYNNEYSKYWNTR